MMDGPVTDGPNNAVDRLQDLILTRMRELDLSGKEAARRAGGLVSYETIRNLARGVRHKGRISDRVAEGLARAFEVPVSRVYDAAGAPTPGQRWDWPQRFDRLNPAQRGLVEDVAAAMLEAYEQGRRDAAQQ